MKALAVIILLLIGLAVSPPTFSKDGEEELSQEEIKEVLGAYEDAIQRLNSIADREKLQEKRLEDDIKSPRDSVKAYSAAVVALDRIVAREEKENPQLVEDVSRKKRLGEAGKPLNEKKHGRREISKGNIRTNFFDDNGAASYPLALPKPIPVFQIHRDSLATFEKYSFQYKFGRVR